MLDLSDGRFSLDEWEKVFEEAKKECCKAGEESMDEGRLPLQGFLERVVEGKVEGERGWKTG